MKDANCYDSFARFVGNYEKDMKTDDDRLLSLARRSFPDLSPPYPTLFLTLTLGLELHPFKASSVGRPGLAALLQMPQTCQPMSIGLTTYALLRYPRLLLNRHRQRQRPSYPIAQPRSRISPPLPPWQALQTRWQCTLDWRERYGQAGSLEWRAVTSQRKSLEPENSEKPMLW